MQKYPTNIVPGGISKTQVVNSSRMRPDDDDDDYSGDFRSSSGNSKTPALDNFSRDLTELAQKGELDPIVGRDSEIERVSQILARRKKNNPVLIGEPGVGKSAIAEGLALRIIQRKVSKNLLNKRVIVIRRQSYDLLKHVNREARRTGVRIPRY